MIFEFNWLVNQSTAVKIETSLKQPKNIFDLFKFSFYAPTSVALTLTKVLSPFPFLNSTRPSVSANNVKSLPTPTFLPG